MKAPFYKKVQQIKPKPKFKVEDLVVYDGAVYTVASVYGFRDNSWAYVLSQGTPEVTLRILVSENNLKSVAR